MNYSQTSPLYGLLSPCLQHPSLGQSSAPSQQVQLRISLCEMLSVAAHAKCILLDTNSASGAPTDATKWLHMPLAGSSRCDASLQSLLQLPPLSLPKEQAELFHEHACKRFMLNVLNDSPLLNELDASPIPHLSTPTSSQLSRCCVSTHSLPLSCQSVTLEVQKVFDLLCRAQLALRAATARVLADPSRFSAIGSWSSAGPFSQQ